MLFYIHIVKCLLIRDEMTGIGSSGLLLYCHIVGIGEKPVFEKLMLNFGDEIL